MIQDDNIVIALPKMERTSFSTVDSSFRTHTILSIPGFQGVLQTLVNYAEPHKTLLLEVGETLLPTMEIPPLRCSVVAVNT